MSQTKLFSDLYLAKFLDTSAKPFFPCTIDHSMHLNHFNVYDISATLEENLSNKRYFTY